MAHGGRARGGDGRGHKRAVWSNKRCTGSPFWRMEGGQGGRWGGQKAVWEHFVGSLKNLTTGAGAKAWGGGAGRRWGHQKARDGGWGGGGG